MSEPCPVCEGSLVFVGEVSGEYHYECTQCTTQIRPGRDSWVRCFGCAKWCSGTFSESPHRKLLHHVHDLREQGYGDQEIANELNWLRVKTQRNKLWSRTSITKIINRSPIGRAAGSASQLTYCSKECRINSREISNEEDGEGS